MPVFLRLISIIYLLFLASRTKKSSWRNRCILLFFLFLSLFQPPLSSFIPNVLESLRSVIWIYRNQLALRPVRDETTVWYVYVCVCIRAPHLYYSQKYIYIYIYTYYTYTWEWVRACVSSSHETLEREREGRGRQPQGRSDCQHIMSCREWTIAITF